MQLIILINMVLNCLRCDRLKNKTNYIVKFLRFICQEIMLTTHSGQYDLAVLIFL